MMQTFGSSALNTALYLQSCWASQSRDAPVWFSAGNETAILLSKKRGIFLAVWREGGVWDGAMKGTSLSLKLPFSKSYFWHPLSSLVTSRVTWCLPSPETFWNFVGKLVFLSFWFVAGLATSSRKLPKSGLYPSFCILGS